VKSQPANWDREGDKYFYNIPSLIEKALCEAKLDLIARCCSILSFEAMASFAMLPEWNVW
jgi:hypothetical protein